jgi:tetratricopeptide (TPR) repeat protein
MGKGVFQKRVMQKCNFEKPIRMEAIMKKVAFFIIMVFALFAVSDTILAKTDTEYDTALKYYYSGNYKEAIRLFKKYVKKKPDSSACYYIAYALYKIGGYDEANKYFKEAYLIDPMFSPVKPESLQKFPEQRIKEIPEPSIEQVLSKQIPYVTETKEEQPEMKLEPVPER